MQVSQWELRPQANEDSVPEACLQLQGAARSTVTLCPASWGGVWWGVVVVQVPLLLSLIPESPINSTLSLSLSLFS